MKNKMITILKILLIVFLMICSQYEIFSQATAIRKVKYNGLFFGFSGGQSQSYIVNKGASSVSGLLSNKMVANIGLFEIGYFFSQHFGLSTGIGFDSYKTQLTLNTYENNFSTIDSENESYERRVSGKDIKELQAVDFLTVPFCVNLRIPVTKTIGLFIQAGANVALPINNRYSSSGTFTYKGYYQTYNALLENLASYGFPNNYYTTADGELEMQEYTLNAIASAGFDFFVWKKLQVATVAFYSKSLSDITAYTSPDNFQLSSDVDQINSMMGGSKVTLESMGIKISLRYFLRSPGRNPKSIFE